MKRIPIIASLIFFILLCVSGSYWVMQLIQPEKRKISAPQEAKAVADVESVAGLFGGAMVVDTSYQLKGLIQANPMDQSQAILEVDGSPMKAFSVNSDVSSGSVLSEVFSSYVLLKGGGVNKRVELPQQSNPSSSYITPVTRPPIGMQPADQSHVEKPAPNRNSRGSRR